jgi:hypothetical protein
MLAATATMTMMTTVTTAVALAVLTKTMAATAVVWVVAHPCCFVRLAHRGAPKIGLQQQSEDCWKGLFKMN